VPAAEKAAAAARNPKSLDKKLKNMRSSYDTAAKECRQSEEGTAAKYDAFIMFGGAVLFDKAKVVFDDCPASKEHALLEPVDFLLGAENDSSGHGEGAPVAGDDKSEGGVVPAAESTGAVPSGARNEEDGTRDDEDARENDHSDGERNAELPSGACLTSSAAASPGKS